jgi:ubiquinone/menaquinone biosynthesis C-methylase UbiE
MMRADAATDRYRPLAGAYDGLSAMAEPFRRRAVELLGIGPGEVVIDVGCGTGLCFYALEARIGASGTVIGIDPSPEMLDQARHRSEAARWGNVTLLESAAEDADIDQDADAALFCLAHDVLQSDDALKNVCYSLVPGGRVAVLGGKWTSPYLVGANALTWALHQLYVASFDGFDCPWRKLERHVEALRVEPLLFGTAFLASGSVP